MGENRNGHWVMDSNDKAIKVINQQTGVIYMLGIGLVVTFPYIVGKLKLIEDEETIEQWEKQMATEAHTNHKRLVRDGAFDYKWKQQEEQS